MNPPIDRRSFIKKTALAGALLNIPSHLLSFAKAQPTAEGSVGANRKLRLAVVGTNSRGLAHIEALGGIEGTEIVYICDVEDGALKKGIEAAKTAGFPRVRALKDFRKALEDSSIDAITVATPDHWHTPMAILALKAGKHVYLEKPCSHNPKEGELLIEAIRKYKKLVQMGNQRRSFPNTQKIISEIHHGLIGSAYYARGWYDNSRKEIGRGKPAAVPNTLDYELWQGPAPRKPYVDNLIHYNWHWHWHWGTGEALNNGTHEIDVCRWALKVDFPNRVTSAGGRFAFRDDWETPDTQAISWEYAGQKAISWEGRSCNGFKENGLDRGVMIFGTEGSVLIDGNSYTVFDRGNKVLQQVQEKAESTGTNTVSASGIHLDRLHVKNFVDAILTGSPLNSPVVEAHVSVAMLQLGNISQRCGRALKCEPSTGHVLEDEEAMALWGRVYEPGWAPSV